MASGTCGKKLTWRFYKNGTLTVNGKGEMYDYNSSETRVPWHSYLDSIEKIIVKDGVTSIGAEAFKNCYYLETVKFSNSVKKICDNAFESCWHLAEIKLPAGVKHIGDWSFGFCSDLNGVIIPKGVNFIGYCAFFACHSLTYAIVPASIKEIGGSVFSQCERLGKIYYESRFKFKDELSNGNNAELIPYTGTPPTKSKLESPFNWTYTLTTSSSQKTTPAPEVKSWTSPTQVNPSVSLPIDSIAEQAKQLRAKLLSRMLEENSTTKPAPEKLRWKVEGKTLTVGGVREIKFYTYGDLPWVRSVDAIQEIVIEAGVEKISANAFSECKRLELLTIPASVKTIGDLAFTFCYCGDRSVNGGKNVIWSLADGVLMFKKNPDAKFATNFSIGAVSWRAVEGNVTGVKVERGITPDKRFFDWLGGLSSDVQVSF